MKYLFFILLLFSFNIQAEAWYTCENIHGVTYTPETQFYHEATFNKKVVEFGEYTKEPLEFDDVYFDILHDKISVTEDHFGDVGILFEGDDITMVGVRYKTKSGVITEIYQFHHDTKKMLLSRSVIKNNETQELGMYIANCE